MYVVIIFLPVMYEYFFEKEQDSYLTYVGLMLEYVVSSFREAFGGIAGVLNMIFFNLVRFILKL